MGSALNFGGTEMGWSFYTGVVRRGKHPMLVALESGIAELDRADGMLERGETVAAERVLDRAEALQREVRGMKVRRDNARTLATPKKVRAPRKSPFAAALAGTRPMPRRAPLVVRTEGVGERLLGAPHAEEVTRLLADAGGLGQNAAQKLMHGFAEKNLDDLPVHSLIAIAGRLTDRRRARLVASYVVANQEHLGELTAVELIELAHAAADDDVQDALLEHAVARQRGRSVADVITIARATSDEARDRIVASEAQRRANTIDRAELIALARTGGDETADQVLLASARGQRHRWQRSDLAELARNASDPVGEQIMAVAP